MKVQYDLAKWFYAWPRFAALSLVMLSFALIARYGFMESGWLSAECDGTVAEGFEGWCAAKWLLIQSFLDQRLGWVSLIAGSLAFLSRSMSLALAGWLTGIAGLILYSFDYAAVGAVLSLLVWARGHAQKRNREQQSDCQPGDGLRVEGL